MLIEMMTFSTKGGNSSYETDDRKHTKRFRRGVMHIIVENGQYDVFKLLKKEAFAKKDSSKHKWISDKELCGP